MTASIHSLGQLAITVSDVQKALGFYRDALELNFLFSPSESLAFLLCGDTRLMLSTPQGAGKVGENSILYFKTNDIDGMFKSAVIKGAVVEREPQLAAQMPDHALWIAFLQDPDGNLVGLMEERR